VKKLLQNLSQKRRVVVFSLVFLLLLSFLYVNFNHIVEASFGSWGDSSLIHACKNSRGGIAIVGAGDTCNTNESQLAWVKDVDAGSGLTATRGSDGVTLSLSDASSGWTNASETWTYASADSPSFTFTISGDKTGKYSPGMRAKLTQTTDKYFIITKVFYSSPDTTVTVYGGTDYTLANASITNPYFSTAKAPQGFPLDPAKWTVETIYSSNGNQGNPTQNTWYNIGSVSLDVPVGAWKLAYMTNFGFDANVQGFYNAYVTLSNSNNSESDINFTSNLSEDYSHIVFNTAYKERFVNLSSKTTYYLIVRTTTTGLGFLYNGGSNNPTIIQAVCSYL
jgi:hypothetical protein